MAGILAAALLAGCAGPRVAAPPPAPPPATFPATPAPATPPARWQAVDWHELPGWGSDDLLAAWPALVATCTRPAPAWRGFCAEVLLAPPGDALAATALLTRHLRPWRVVSETGDTGLLTGYVEPEFSARRQRGGAYQWPVLALPGDATLRRLPRRELDAHPRVAELALAYLDNPMDVQMLQVQGSGRLRLQEPDGREQAVRLSFSGHNEQPFESIARALLARGELRDASWPGLRDWAQRHPAQVAEALAVNPRVVFFRADPLRDATQGPRGAQGVPLSPGRSIAIDRTHHELGAPLWLAAGPLQRLVVAQDTGGAITGRCGPTTSGVGVRKPSAKPGAQSCRCGYGR